MKEYRMMLDELPNYVDEGTIFYKGKRYDFDSYYCERFDYVMINYGEEYEDEDGTGQVEIFEVGRLDMDAIILRVIGDKVYEIEDLPEDEDIDY